MDKIIEGATLVEIDKSKKYVFLVREGLSLDSLEEVRDKLNEWIMSGSPFLVVDGTVIKLLEVEKDEK